MKVTFQQIIIESESDIPMMARIILQQGRTFQESKICEFKQGDNGNGSILRSIVIQVVSQKSESGRKEREEYAIELLRKLPEKKKTKRKLSEKRKKEATKRKKGSCIKLH